MSGLSRHVHKRWLIDLPWAPLHPSVTAGNPTCGLLTRRNQSRVGAAHRLERKKNQVQPLPDAFLRWFMWPMGLNSIGLLLMSMTPHPFFSLRTVMVTRSTLPSAVSLSM